MTTTEPKTEPLAIEVPTGTVAKAAESTGTVAKAAESKATVARAADQPANGFSIFGVAKRVWIVLVIAAVVAVAGFCVYRLRGIFGVHDHTSASSSISDDIKPFNPKHVLYEVFGPPGTVANINYLDIKAQPQRVDHVPLPWTLSVTTTLPSVSVNIVAQGDTDEIGCRITVNGEVKAERFADGVNAQTFCLVKSA